MRRHLILSLLLLNVLSVSGASVAENHATGRETVKRIDAPTQSAFAYKSINFVFRGDRRTPNPPGWQEYDGSIYNPERGYGWLTDFSAEGADRGAKATITLVDGTATSPQQLDRLELANWQGKHPDNVPIVFRIDVPNGWYRVTCTSVAPGRGRDGTSRPLPLVDMRSFKCRAHDVVFAGATYGAPLVVSGTQLVEGTGLVEATEGQLRIVVGDPAYAGWSWRYSGPWYEGWKEWWSWNHRFANTSYQKIARTVDPGFHSLRLNSLEIAKVPSPVDPPTILFRDFFNRDDSHDINVGLAEANRWTRVNLNPVAPDTASIDLYKTSVRVAGYGTDANTVGLLQQAASPTQGTIRYSTRVSLFAGEGGQRHSGTQEAGLLILVEPSMTGGLNGTFVGVALHGVGEEIEGRLRYYVDNGKGGSRSETSIEDDMLPIQITEGEYEIVVLHDVEQNVLRQIRVNGVDVTPQFSLRDRTQRVSKGLYGIRSSIHSMISNVTPRHFYWYYRVEQI